MTPEPDTLMRDDDPPADGEPNPYAPRKPRRRVNPEEMEDES